ncbi:MAG TPA: hypothetical protein VMS37_29355 [Verrucomicrobiae bacterium]|nr:hypothetical protein [Verrucomicrobiae bacterium]
MSTPEVRLRWWVPDLAMVAACVTLFYCVFLFQGYQKLFRDSDAGWHIRNGEAILATGTLPRTDPYSFTRSGRPWFAWEWLSDLAVGALHRAGGLNAVALFYSAAIAFGVWLWFRLHWALGGNFLIACAMAPLLLSTCNMHWLARPHILGWLFLLWAMFPAGLASTAAMTVLWANVHPSFYLGILGRVGLRPALLTRHAAVILTLGVLNPYGPALYTHLYRYLTDSALLARIGEFQSFDFHAEGAGQIVATVILGMIGGTLAFTRKQYHHFVIAIVITALALRSARALPLCALVLLPIANAAIAPYCGKSFNRYAANLRALDARCRGLWLAPVALAAVWFLMPKAGFPPGQFPVAAYGHIPAGARLFAPDKYGGYLIYRSNGTMKVFFDGRSDLYGAGFLEQYARLTQLRPGWQEIWNSYHFTHALLPNDYSLVPALEQLGWHVIYLDRTATLLEKPMSAAD